MNVQKIKVKNIGEDQEPNVENLKCCGNCIHSHMEGENVCCNAIHFHNPVDMRNRCLTDWEFDQTNYIDRIVKEE